MTIGPATVLAIVASVLATLLWVLATKLSFPPWLAMLLFGMGLTLVILAGPLIRLP